ncbi:hypothetical protein AAZX31_12G192600 [Glycine max]|uniref:C2H2-type domain-containing protein n=2 Tax=Glycine subgen. Soja TaxID=1462606 RepID=I1LUF9_SOYBN|nr:uncharacterized protein LOC100779572 [Glycine max]XP_006592839.1 uncharacterized protein LOC100779572 [Glycine max]XP_028193672.1 uncharacterized protein LOC114379245 [Glycine soja]XP_028193673.1 uncharacterized protein LOC114379245 [Glycine soja]KAG4986868.1 hypothetical protein JHK86_034559 [Glycine max]KAG5120068.1 hypothetical protein JHK82_034488 [Glycine max]KAG5141055.1 hypothetical protein JHK84_034823 [Glycine max]KAH1222581.1 hypothetical protein GmHk_12G035699 [Glycine max]KAH|eukprot:XP_003540357.1 uncharacterized protein LOC100779572 [Glycine max]
MAGKLELGPPKSDVSNPKEQAARKILKIVRSQGHPYVELRENGKKFIYFCTLCLAPCYSDDVLFDHLKGNLHKERLSAAKVTLLGPKPWPFNDGLVFFDTSTESHKELEVADSYQNRLLKFNDNDVSLAIVKFGDGVQSNAKPRSIDGMQDDEYALVIPNLLIGDEIFDVKVREVGLGKIAARFLEKCHALNGIKRIWCEWLGKESNGERDGVEVLEHDFAVVIFAYNYDLGRSGLLDDVNTLLPSASGGQKGKSSLSDFDDVSDSVCNQYDSSAEESSDSNNSSSRLTLDQFNNHLCTRFISSKALRKELRRKQRLAAEKVCNICQQKMLPGKDVAALLNLKTRRVACSSRNRTGAFHVFHTSCLIHWIILCEFEIITNHLVCPNVRRVVKRKVASDGNKIGKEKDIGKHIRTVFCPECQGTGMIIDGDGVEQPEFSLSQMFKFKIKACDARRDWIKSPEVLKNCSTGFHFPSQSEEIFEEKVEPINLLHFYRADDQSWA